MGMIFDIKEMAVHDGPGLRTTVFLKGCPLRCVWCHNPEGLSAERQLYVWQNGCKGCSLCRRGCSHPDCQPFGRCLHVCPQGLITVAGREMSAEQLAKRILRSAAVADGVTFSGGEPLMQAEFVLDVVDKLSKMGSRTGGGEAALKREAALEQEALRRIHCAIETSGYGDPEVFQRVIQAMDFVYMDLKLADETLHRKYTGVSNRLILQNLEILRCSAVPCTIRTPLIPGITDTKENIEAIRRLAGDLPLEFLEYNPMAGAKYSALGMKFPLERSSAGTLIHRNGHCE